MDKLHPPVVQEIRHNSASPDTPVARIAVVVPTRNRAGTLEQALASYLSLKHASPWELIVVDNGSTDHTPALLAEFSQKGGVPFRHLVERKPGASAARNTGWRASAAPVIAFTDDDCYPHPDWLARIADEFEDASIGFVGGRVVLHDPEDYPITIQLKDQREELPSGRFIPAGLIHGANMAVRREALEQVDGFNEALGAGTPYVCEDVDLLSRLLAAGVKGIYAPRPTIAHHHRRRTPEQVSALKRTYDYGRGAYYAACLLDPGRRRSAIKPFYWHWRDLLRNSIRHPQRLSQGRREVSAAVRYWLDPARNPGPNRASTSPSHR